MKSINKLALSSAVLVAMLAVTACSSGTKEPAKPSAGSADKPAAQADAPKKDVNLKFSIWGDDARKKRMEEVVKLFTDKNPHIKVEIMLIPFAEYQQKMSIMTASNTAPDVIWLSEKMIPQFIESKQLLDITAIQSDTAYDFKDLFGSSLDIYKKDGKLFGVSFTNPPKVLYYNKTLFKEKNLKTPTELAKEGKWTYDEFLKAAKALTDSSKGQYGAHLFGANGWKAWQDALLDTIFAYGAEFMNAEGTKFTLNSAQGEQVLQLVSDMIFKDQVHPKPGDQITFETGKLAMSRQNYSYVNNARKITNFEWDIAPMPTGSKKDAPTAIGLAGYSVTANTKHPKEATELLKFMTGKQGMTELASMFVPNRVSILSSDALTKGFTAPTQDGIKLSLVDPMSKSVRIQDSHKNWQQVDTKVQTVLDLLYTRSMSVKDVLKKMDDEVTPLLK